MVQVSIVEDDPELRGALAQLIDNTKGYSCAGAYQDCEAAIREIGGHKPDIVLMDIALPGMSGVEGVHIIKHQWPEIEVLMLTIHAEESVIFECLRSGATGYLLKNGNPKDLLNALREVMNGGAPMSMTIARKVAESFRKKPGREPLTHREEDVLSRLHQGHSYQAIADELFISRDTVKYHIKNIYRKLNVNNKVDAVLKQ